MDTEKKKLEIDEPTKEEECRRLFHTVWTKAVGTNAYKKSEWRELRNLLIELGVNI